MNTLTAYTLHNIIQCPDVEVLVVLHEHTVVPIRGWGYQCVVFDDNVCIGYVDCKTLGYATVKHWMIATDWQDKGL